MPTSSPVQATTTLAAPLDDLLKNNYRSNSVNGMLFLIFAAIALILASVGLYAVVAHSVGQRTQEIGIRRGLFSLTG